MSTKALTWLLTIVEAVVLFAIGYYIYTNPAIKNLGEIFFVISTIIVVNRLISNVDDVSLFDNLFERIRQSIIGQNEAIEKLETPIKQLAKVVDLTNNRGLSDIDEVVNSYISIRNPKLNSVKDSIIQKAISELRQLNYEQKTPILDEPDFYQWLFTEFSEARQGTTIDIVSMGGEVEWTDTYEEREFWEHNLNAAKRGAAITRIFLFDLQRLQAARNNPAIYGHRKGSRTGVVGKVVDKNRFERNSPAAIEGAGQGFILIDNRMAIVDVFSDDGQARGYITFNPEDIRKYREVFQKFSIAAKDLEFDD